MACLQMGVMDSMDSAADSVHQLREQISVAAVDGWFVLARAAEPVHETREQIAARSIA
jgi:hypothetical protein